MDSLYNEDMSKKSKRKIAQVRPVTSGDYFDDCPVCQAMKQAGERGRDMSFDELTNAFREAKKQGAVVGGKIFDEEKKKN